MPSSWRHTLCLNCFMDIRPGVRPVTLTEPQPPESCCRCRRLTAWPVYYRAEPHAFPCAGQHPADDA